jgi:hypothetical protein
MWPAYGFEYETPVFHNIFAFIGGTKRGKEMELYVKFMLGAIKIKE